MAIVDTQKDSADLVSKNASPVRGRIIVQYPDITLKGRNQPDFQNALYSNIRQYLKYRGYYWKIGASHGRACIDIPAEQAVSAIEVAGILRQIPGIYSLAITSWVHPQQYHHKNGELNWRDIGDAIVELAAKHYISNSSFALRINRTDKSLPVTSQEIGTRLGALIRENTDWDIVNLSDPGKSFYIDVHPDGFYMYAEKLKAVGGLPVGTGGRVLSLLSGGIDSPVAAYMLAKRGCNVDFMHLSAGHMRQAELMDSVIVKLAAQLSRFTQDSRLYIVPNTYFDLALSGKHSGYELVLFRRFMMRVAEKLAYGIKAAALVNGDSLGQVASQTLENLVSVSVTAMPVFRPLIGSNKDEIIELARHIQTYEISILPYKDCCAILSRHPKTRTQSVRLDAEEQERLPGYETIVEQTLADMQCLQFRFGKLVEIEKAT